MQRRASVNRHLTPNTSRGYSGKPAAVDEVSVSALVDILQAFNRIVCDLAGRSSYAAKLPSIPGRDSAETSLLHNKERLRMAERNVYQELAEAIGARESNLIPKTFEALADHGEAKMLLAASPAHGE